MADKKQYFVIDFDSTFIKSESIEDLAEIALDKNPQKSQILNQIKELTRLGMEGKMPINQTLKKRFELLNASQDHLKKVIKLTKKNISPSIKRNKKFFSKYKDQIYIISSGFRQIIEPILEEFGIPKNHLLVNDLILKNGKIIGFDPKNPLTQDMGKAKAIKALKLDGEIIMIGDGFTDYQAKQAGAASKFVAFTENIQREEVTQVADLTVKSFDEFLYAHNLPMAISFPKSKLKALLLENIDQKAVDNFKEEGYQVELLKSALDEEELSKKIKGVSILGIRSKTKITKNILDKADKLKVIGAFCIGTDQMDLSSVTKKGIVAFNAPFQNTRSVVELAIGEMIMLLRGVTDKNNLLHQGIWDKSAKGSNEIRGKKLGIVGYGNIGSQLSILAEGLGMEVYFYDIIEKLSLGNAKRCQTLEELLKISDIITIHVSGDRVNTNLIGQKEFQKMKDGVVFLNLSRGFIVDIKALEGAIRSGKVRGAALDVFPKEPKGKDDPFVSKLQGLPNTILTPHIAGSTQEAQKEIGYFVSSKIIDYINGGSTYLSVNFPQIQLPEQKKTHRILHIHKNIPGILAQINKIFADNKINILGQYLKTNDTIGYVITDVDKEYDKKILEDLKKIPNTIGFRLLY